MNDDEVSVRVELASAYLDGELDTDERATVAADPATMAMVDSFTRVRDVLGTVDPATADAKDAAISAALTRFDALHEARAVTAVHAPASVLHQRWRRSYRFVGGLAAAAIIAVVAFGALLSSRGDDMKSSSATEVPAAADAATEPPTLKVEAAPAGTSAPGGAAESATMLPVINNADDLARYASSYASDAATTAAAPVGDDVPGTTVLAPVALTPPTSCLTPNETVLGPISVLGSLAYAVRDSITGVVRAVDGSDCSVRLVTDP